MNITVSHALKNTLSLMNAKILAGTISGSPWAKMNKAQSLGECRTQGQTVHQGQISLFRPFVEGDKSNFIRWICGGYRAL